MKEIIKKQLAEKYFNDIFHNLGNYNDLFSITLIMQELYIEKELFIKRTTENDCRALVLRGTLEYLFDEIIAGECALALLQKEIKKD